MEEHSMHRTSKSKGLKVGVCLQDLKKKEVRMAGVERAGRK